MHQRVATKLKDLKVMDTQLFKKALLLRGQLKKRQQVITKLVIKYCTQQRLEQRKESAAGFNTSNLSRRTRISDSNQLNNQISDCVKPDIQI